MLIIYLTMIYSCIGSVYLDYIYYKKLNRKCLPYYDCPPDHEILPCEKNFQEDKCRRCKKGYVQPDLLSSSGRIHETSCFKPIATSECLAHDITYSKNKHQNAFCDSLPGCKCRTDLCYFGDPCLCSTKERCGIGKTLTNLGVCVPCPENTYKNDTGCGPCRRIRKRNQTAVIIQPLKITRTAIVIHSTQQPLSSERPIPVYSSISPQPLQQERKNNDNHILIPVIVVLGVIFVFLLVAISVYCIRKPGIVLTGICWSHDNTEQQNRQDRNHTQRVALIRNPTDEDSVTVNMQTALPKVEQKGLYPNLLAINGDTKNAALTDASSTESGFHEDSDENMSGSDPLINQLCLHTEMDSKCARCLNKRDILNIDQQDNDDCSYETKKEQPSQDCSTGNDSYDDFGLSSSLSPVVTETEPHICSSFSKTRKSFALTIPDTIDSYPLASGEYIPMNESALDSSNTNDDSIVSDLEYFNHEIRGTYNSCKSYGGKSETKPKHSGPNSLDSGVFGSEKNECQ
ncbi:uncharacterized protein LOC127719464 isoform X3 [Mytilus californianus]|nr:uncharacterized protein LOC127719464 isoform X3 [Mytilus californianus]XP_052081538.1 uncharacterized protein LOC127719464 isoform X3 [Mytilus californianus]